MSPPAVMAQGKGSGLGPAAQATPRSGVPCHAAVAPDAPPTLTSARRPPGFPSDRHALMLAAGVLPEGNADLVRVRALWLFRTSVRLIVPDPAPDAAAAPCAPSPGPGP